MPFYFVETTVAEQRELLCRLTERFYTEKHKVQILVDSTPDAQLLDGLLWAFSQGSFIPHAIWNPESELPVEPVLISIGERQFAGFDVVLCDSSASLEFMAKFETAVHFILRDDDGRRQESRLLWQKARGSGLNPVHVPYGQQI
ncbi:MAG: DNA polymerase III subunit chi [Syntrophobacteraceae bacterium]